MNVIKKINVDGVEYDIQGKELTKVTYAELKELRDNGELVEGHLYRITDYEFTTVQADTKSAGHVFDIIVLATSTNELSHIARAIAHEGDTYFDGNDLGAWEMWYDLDNDTDKYAWADAENGKGVIYRMIDDKRNDCPYDFKNALFFNDKLTTYTTEDKYYYTFSYVVDGVLYDGTVEKQVTVCYGNSMDVNWSNKKRFLNMNVWRNNTFWSSCNNNTFGNNCAYNTFGNSCNNNTFWSSCNNNTFGNNCAYNTFGSRCNNNTFGSNCAYNTFGDECSYNHLAAYCNYNTFRGYCRDNQFSIHSYSNTLGYDCYKNTFNPGFKSKFGDGVTKHHISVGNISITSNDECYDDGSGQLVPVKHPDLSTQPSILPYKFMGNYVYEQLIYIGEVQRNGSDEIELAKTINLEDLEIFPSVVLECKAFVFGDILAYDGNEYEAKGKSGFPIHAEVSFDGDSSPYQHGLTIKATVPSIFAPIDWTFGFDQLKNVGVYARIVYTSMPEDSSYYGY